MGCSTKERILDAALESFAENGYKGTNLRDLAASLGLSKSALYRHYESKEDIWNAVIDRMEEYYGKNVASSENVPQTLKSCDELLSMTMDMIKHTVSDKKIILVRQVLLTEQFHNERARKLTTLHFVNYTKDIFTRIFTQMMNDGLLKKDDPEMLAFAYTSPISALIQLCDRDHEKTEETLALAEKFVRQFIKNYST